jgi:hypothetical protein
MSVDSGHPLSDRPVRPCSLSDEWLIVAPGGRAAGQRPLELELDLLLLVTPFVLDGRIGRARDAEPLTGDLDPERLVGLDRVS